MPYHAEATLTGIIMKELKWIYFLPKMQSVIPISIAVFPDDMWMPEEQSTFFDKWNMFPYLKFGGFLLLSLLDFVDDVIPAINRSFVIKAYKEKQITLVCTYDGHNPNARCYIYFFLLVLTNVTKLTKLFWCYRVLHIIYSIKIHDYFLCKLLKWYLRRNIKVFLDFLGRNYYKKICWICLQR